MDAGDFDPASMPTSTRQIPVIVAFSIMFAAASVAVGLRFYTRMKFLGGFKTEDWFILAAWVFSIGVTIGFIRQTYLTLGHHVWTIKSTEIAMASAMEEWYSFLFYVISLGFTKVSILFLYRRILPPGRTRTANHVLMGAVIVCSVWATVAMFISCIPLRAMWDKSVKGRCLGLGVSVGNSVLNVVTDFAIFALPLPSIARLRMHRRKKAGLLFVFTLGFVVCLVSIVRIVWLTQMDKTDFTYNMAVVAYWGAVEVNLPIICACLVTIRPLLNTWFPGFLGSSAAESSSRYDQAGYNRTGSTFRGRQDWETAASRGMGTRTCGEEEDEVAGNGSSGESLIFMMQDVEATAGSGKGVKLPMKVYGGLG